MDRKLKNGLSGASAAVVVVLACGLGLGFVFIAVSGIFNLVEYLFVDETTQILSFAVFLLVMVGIIGFVADYRKD